MDLISIIENLTFAAAIVFTLIFIIKYIVSHIRGVAICKNEICLYGKKVCCKHCKDRDVCGLTCNYKGKCKWRDWQ